MLYFDISLEETIKRHAGREKAKIFSEKEITYWYVQATPADYDFEEMIPEEYTIEQIVEFIKNKTGL